MANRNLHQAKKVKKDEFHTQLSDIEKELKHYRGHFKDKVVYCNCDDPRVSKFFHYFSYNFSKLGLKRLIATCYRNQQMDMFSQNNSEQAIWLEYTGDKNGNRVPDADEIGTHHLEGDGDFRSEECIELLKQADIVVTNPPFSLFREYVAQLVEYEKQFLIIGNLNAITYKEIFKLIKENRLWLGYTHPKTFIMPPTYPLLGASYIDKDGNKVAKFGNICWFTNLPTNKRTEGLVLCKRYYGYEDEYPHYDNYDAIEVSRVVNIPMDYEGVMGVPITFLGKYNPGRFEIIGMAKRGAGDPALKSKVYTKNDTKNYSNLNAGPVLKTPTGLRNIYPRILIRNKKVEK